MSSKSWKHETDKELILYKYRNFDSFENVVDIIVNSRLYAASYKNMNDPMEGCYDYAIEHYNDDYIQDKLETAIEKQKFCSLSKKPNIDLMWGHYSKGHRGICFGIKLKNTKKGGKSYVVRYDGISNLTPAKDSRNIEERAQKILRYKNPCWEYEEEVRLFSTDGHLVDIEIVEVLFGSRVEQRYLALVNNLVSNYLPNLKFDEKVNGFT